VGSATKNRCLLFLFAGLLSALILLEIATMVLAWYYQRGSTMEQKLDNLIKNAISNKDSQIVPIDGSYPNDGNGNNIRNEITSNILNLIQYSLHCCGAKGPHDYKDIGQDVPPSCIRYVNGGTEMFTQGCVDALQSYIFRNGMALGLLSCFAVLLQLALIGVSLKIAYTVGDYEA